MNDSDKSKEQLIAEIQELRKTVDDLRGDNSRFEKKLFAPTFMNSKRLLKLFHNYPISMQIISRDGTTLRVNKAWEKIWEIKWRDFIKLHHNHFEDQQLIEKGVTDYIRRAFAGETFKVQADRYYFSPNNSYDKLKWIEAWVYPIEESPGTINHILVVHEDVTDSVTIEAEKHKSEMRFSKFINAAIDGFTLWDSEFNLLDINKTELKWHPEGTKAEDIIGKNCAELVPNIKSTGRYDQYMSVIKTGKPILIDGIVPDPKFGDKVFSCRAFKVGDGLGVISTDVTEQRMYEKQLRESEEKFRSVIENSNDAIYILQDDKFEMVNPSFVKLSGYSQEEILSDNFDMFSIIAPEDIQLILDRKAAWRRGDNPPNVYEFRVLSRSGKLHYLEASVSRIEYGNNTAILGILRDISDQKELEAKLRQAQKIESIGYLAGGIAHDFNNLLTPIIGNAELAMMDMEQDEPHYEYMKEIHDTAFRAGELTRQLLAFSRKQVLQIRQIHLDNLIENFLPILRRTTREDINFKFNFDKSLHQVKVDVSQIEQILLNLVMNAQDAMPNGGDITIKTKNISINKNDTNEFKDMPEGEHILLEISDTGEGIDDKIMQKIFDPFYTTKEVDKGTGLGLSTVHGIVKQHGGNIYVESTKGKGTTFRIFLPVPEKEKIAASEKSKSLNKRIIDASILIVEDQNLVCETARRILEKHGFTVYKAGNGQEALSIIRNQNIKVDLLITDVIMPEMNGQELYNKIKQEIPDIKVLFMSGHTRDVIAKHGILEEGLNFIQKPLGVVKLIDKVNLICNR